MNHIFKKIGVVALGLTMAIGVGVSLGKNSYKVASAAAGDEVTSVANIVDGGEYYIKGVRSSSTYYLTFTDEVGSQSGTEASKTSGAVKLTFTKVSNGVYNITTPSGYYIGPGTSNGKINVSESAINVSASNQSSKIRLSITSGGNTWSIQKNTSAANFGGYKNTQSDITLIEAESSITYTSLTVDTAPTKTTYTKYETFDPSGMVVKATDGNGKYSDALTLNTHYTYSPTTALTTVGSQTITLSGAGTYQGLSGSTTVTVSDLSNPLTANPGVTLSPNSTNIYEGKTASLTVTTTPSPTDEPISVTSSNDEVLAVSGTGPYTLTAGAVDSNTNVTISVSGAEGTYHTDTVFTVKPNNVTVSIDKTSYTKMTLGVGDEFALTNITASGTYDSGDPYAGEFAWSYYMSGELVETVPNNVGTDLDLTVRATASDNHYAETTVKIDIEIRKGSQYLPYTVAEAVAAAEDIDFYVTGYVSKLNSASTNNYGIYLSDSFSTSYLNTTALELFKPSGVTKNSITTSNYKSGAKIVAHGTHIVYNEQHELDAGCVIDTNTAPVLQSLTVSGAKDTYEDNEQFVKGDGFTALANFNVYEGYDVSSSVSLSPISLNTRLHHDTHNGQTITASYTYNNVTKTDTYDITVHYAATSSITLDKSEETLYKNDIDQLTATLNTYADPASVTWVSSDPTIVSVDSDGYVQSYAKGGEATVTAFFDADEDGVLDNEETVKDSCVYTVIIDKLVEIDQSVMAAFTGDDYKLIEVTNVQNFGNSPLYVWASSDEDVAEVDGDSDGALVDIKAAGTANITLTVKDNNEDVGATATCVLNVTQSQVDAIELTATPNITTLYVGETISLKPSVTKTGNANKTVDWASNNTSAATVSAAQTENEGAITVTAVAAGSARITATSHYDGGTPKSATYDVLVKDDVLTLEWNDRGTQNFTVGDKFALKAGASLAATYENPRVDDVALTLGTSGVVVLLNGSEINKDTYTFTANDDGKTIAIKYTDAASRVSTTTTETIKVLRSVTTTGEATGEITFGASYSYDGEAGALATVNGFTKNSYAYYESNALRFGNADYTGTATVTLQSASSKIISVTVHAKAYGSDASPQFTMTSGDTSETKTATASYANYTLTIDEEDAVNTFTISSLVKKKRVVIDSISFTVLATVDKSQSSAAIELHDFINEFMHMKDVSTDNNNDTGACKGNSGYYALAKAEFNTLSAEARALFVSHSAYALEYARLAAWANANGDKFETTEGENLNKLVEKSNVNLFVTLSNNTPTIIVIFSIISVSAIGGYFFLRKKKQY